MGARQFLTFLAAVSATIAASAISFSAARAREVTYGFFELESQDELDQAAAEIRARGPQGLEDLLRSYNSYKLSAEEAEKFRCVIDQVAAQRGGAVSRLYWHTDLDHAKEAAAESGKPILSLRMLGKLTDEFSCANSRYFRTALYSNTEISDYLREHYVLHWQSVRPVPVVTIDFGDGRKLERTVTGNSAHYVLDAEGRPLDVLPGLYGPKAFAEWLARAHDYSQQMSHVADAKRERWVVTYHREQLAAVDQALRADLAAFAPALLLDPNAVEPPRPSAVDRTTALQAGLKAVTKTVVEQPLIAAFVPDGATLHIQDEALWQQIAEAHAADAKLDEASVAVIRRENPTALQAGALAISKKLVEDPILRLVRSFESAMALDTIKNEYLLHREIHRWFIAGEAPADVDQLNERVYAELFLTPSSDPWLGLAPADAYTALEKGGLQAAN